MRIVTDVNNVITAILYAAHIDGSIEIKGDIPENIEPMKWCYTAEKGFYENPEYTPPSADISSIKFAKIEESKTKLAEWLANNPLLFTDGKYYSVTEEKQALLNGNLASYERATKAGIEYPLKWNSTGEECTEWNYNDLLTLSLSIAAYVAPKVAMQQKIELDIKACETMDELNAIVIDYDEAK